MKKVFIIIIASVGMYSCGQEESLEQLKAKQKQLNAELSTIESKIEKLDTASHEAKSLLVTVDTIATQPFSHNVKFQGVVEADKNIFVYPEASGVITSIRVKDGQRITKGSVIATIDSEILGKNIQEVEKSLELANYMLQKQEDLRSKGLGTEVQYEQAKNQKESLEKRLETMKTQAGKTVVTAPFSGFIDEVMMEQGQLAGPQTPILRMFDIGQVTLKSEISEKYLLEVKQGTKVDVFFPSIDLKLENLNVSRTTKFINPANRTFDVEVDILNSGEKIYPNLYAEVLVRDYYNPQARVIPVKSILEDKDGNKYVFVLEPKTSTVVKKSVEVNYTEEGLAELKGTSELKLNDIIIVGGARALSEGTKVSIAKNLD